MLALILLCVLSAGAQDAVKLEVVRKGQVGQTSPSLVLHAQDSGTVAVKLRCGSESFNLNKPMNPGEDLRLDLPVGLGSHTCSGSLEISLSDGEEGSMPLSFGVEVLAPMKLDVDRARVKVSAHSLELRADRPLKSAEVGVYTPEGVQIGIGEVHPGNHPAGRPLLISWTQSDGDVMRIEVIGTDIDGFFSKYELFPWYYEIPHEDVVFETNSDLIRDGEVAKLSGALVEVNKVLARYGQVAAVNLYVAGYTDTTGDAASNKALSERRAISIARWYRKNGFKGTIYYQGFGERGLAISTGDEVDEAANRRAAYIVAAEAPPTSGGIPDSAWRKLD